MRGCVHALTRACVYACCAHLRSFQRKARAAGADADDDESAPDAPRKWEDYSVAFSFPEPTELPPPLIQLIDVDFKYPGRDDFGLKNINLGVDMGTRVAIVGPNGAGKSTLLNLLAGDIEPTAGEFRKSHKLRIGRYSQHFVDILQMDESAVEYLLRLFPAAGLSPERMRALLGRFGLEGHNHLSPIIKLSGGQKARVVFAAISLSAPHILLCDEVRCACADAGACMRASVRVAWLRACLAFLCACADISLRPFFLPSPPTIWTCSPSTRSLRRWRRSAAAWCW
jgi:ATPase subunit of ABC transporter with duplicated ATPase domains